MASYILTIVLLVGIGCAAAPELKPSQSNTVPVIDHHAGKADRDAAKHERQRLYVEGHPDKSPEIKEAILHSRILLGMTRDDVRVAFIAPEHVNRTVTSHGVHEQWVWLGGLYVYFEDGLVTSWQDSK